MTVPRSPQLNDLADASRGPQVAGMAIAAAGVLLALVRWRWWPGMPRLVPLATIALALGLIGIGMVRRVRYHWAMWRRDQPSTRHRPVAIQVTDFSGDALPLSVARFGRSESLGRDASPARRNDRRNGTQGKNDP